MKVEARGISSWHAKPGIWILCLARFVDLNGFVIVWAGLVKLYGLAPFPTPLPCAGIFCVWALSLWAQQRWLGRTLGEAVWKLARSGARFWPPKLGRLVRKGVLSEGGFSPAALFTLIAAASAFTCAHAWLWNHPVLLNAQMRIFPPLAPRSPEETRKEWTLAPFYYTYGTWPQQFMEHPILYSLPYEAGPPSHFIGHIVARWRMPDIRLTFEGPKTPAQTATGTRTERADRSQVKDCFTGWKLACVSLRRLTLTRHIEQMRLSGDRSWELTWFEVAQTPGTPDAPAAGLWLTGYGSRNTEEHVILITPSGIQQTLILNRPNGTEGESAHRLLEDTVRSLRMTDSLAVTQSFGALRISETALGGPGEPIDSPDLVSRLAEAQALLLGRLSTAPKDMDAYFHLAGTSLLLLKHSEAMRRRLTASTENSDDSLLMLDEWNASAKPTVQAAYKYAQDVAPESPRTAAIRDIGFEAQKYR